MSDVDWSKIGRRSKRKGKSGEYRIAKMLSEYTGRGFRRTPSSGGFNKQGGVVIAEHKFCGDVICSDQYFLFCVEMKNRPNDFGLNQILNSPDKAPFTSWWHQTIEDAKAVSLLPLLFFKPNVNNYLVGVTDEGLDQLCYPNPKPRVRIDIFREELVIKIRDGKETKEVSVVLPPCVVIGWNHIKKYINPDNFFGGGQNGLRSLQEETRKAQREEEVIEDNKRSKAVQDDKTIVRSEENPGSE